MVNFQGIVRDITTEIKNEIALRDALESQKALMEKQKALLERQRALETVINNSSMVVFLGGKKWPKIMYPKCPHSGNAPEFYSGESLWKNVHPRLFS